MAPSQTLPSSGLPELGDGSSLSTAQERRIGDRIVRDLYRHPTYLDDPVLMDYVQAIWQPLMAAARLQGHLTPEQDERYAWRLMLLRERSVNAFALPGGYLGLHLGLLAMVDGRDALASVLAHELSHVTQRHIARMISKSNQQAPWMLGAMILGMLAASKSPDAGGALMVGGQAVGIQSQLNFSRDMEREADRIGLAVDTQAGYAPQGFVAMFDKLQQEARLNDSGAFPYLRTHPLTTERVADMQARMPPGPAPQPSLAQQALDALMAARAQVLISPNAATLQTWQGLASDATLRTKPLVQQLAALYGAALAALNVRDMPLARQQLRQLQRRVDQVTGSDAPALDAAVRQQLFWLAVEVDLAARDVPPDALAAMATKLQLSAGAEMRRPVVLMLSQLTLQRGQPEDLQTAVGRLQAWLAQNPSDALAWQTLSDLHAAQQLPLRALRDAAEAQLALHNPEAALDRLRAGQDAVRRLGQRATPADQIDASIIDTRFRQVLALVKAQAQER